MPLVTTVHLASRLRLEKIPELKEFGVIIHGLLLLKGAFDALSGRQVLDPIRDPKIEGVATLPETGQKNPITGFGLLQGMNQHDQGMGGTCLPADLMHIIHDLFRRRAQFLGDLAVFSLEKTGKDQSIHVIHGDG